ncbi:MAG: YibE/F family protein [Alkalibacterium sp.]
MKFKTIGTLFLMLLIFSMSSPAVFASDDFNSAETEEEMVDQEMSEANAVMQEEVIERARVLNVEETDGAGLEDGFYTEILSVRLEYLSGEQKGEEFQSLHYLTGNPGYDFELSPGDKVLVNVQEVNGETEGHIVEYVRDTYIYILLGVFVILVVLLGGKKGVKTILTLGLTLFLLLNVLMPALLAGYSPILVTIGISIIITVVTILFVGGNNIKSYSAIIGVLGGVLIAGLIAYVVGNQTRLTGISSQEAGMLMYIPQGVTFDFSGLLFAGIIMGALGAVMDVGMSISSAMEEIRTADPSISTKNLILAGMNVGKDIMGTMANTLILAYIGSMIPLLLLFTAYQEPFISIINMDLIATEVVRALSGSIGLILSIPITAITSGLLRDKAQVKTEMPVSNEVSLQMND